MSTHQTCWFRHGNRKRQEGPKNTNISPRIFFTTTVGSCLSETAPGAETVLLISFFLRRPMTADVLAETKKPTRKTTEATTREKIKQWMLEEPAFFLGKVHSGIEQGFLHTRKRCTVFQKNKECATSCSSWICGSESYGDTITIQGSMDSQWMIRNTIQSSNERNFYLKISRDYRAYYTWLRCSFST